MYLYYCHSLPIPNCSGILNLIGRILSLDWLRKVASRIFCRFPNFLYFLIILTAIFAHFVLICKFLLKILLVYNPEECLLFLMIFFLEFAFFQCYLDIQGMNFHLCMDILQDNSTIGDKGIFTL